MKMCRCIAGVFILLLLIGCSMKKEHIIHTNIPDGRLGHPLGAYLTIEGERAKGGKGAPRILSVDTVNGKKMMPSVGIWIENLVEIPEGKRCVLRGYESGKMIGVPDEVLRKENRPAPQAAWQFYHYFIVTSIVSPTELKMRE